MKKKLLCLILLLLSFTINAQPPVEGFEGIFPPPGWMVLENGIGPAVQWIQSPGGPALPPYEGNHAAYLNRENVGTGIPEDWLVTPQMMASDKIRFFSRLTMGGDQGSIYRVMITNGDPIDMGAYTLLQEWTELEINPEQTTYTEKVVDVPSEYLGQEVRFAFVMIADNGDKWLIDNVSFEVDCAPPTNIEIDFEGSTATASWEAEEGVDQWEVYIMPGYQTFVGDEEGIIVSGEPSYTFNSLIEDELYKVYIRTICSDDNIGWWVGPTYTETIFNDNTLTGTLMYDSNGDNTCEEADYIPSIPISVNINNDFIYYTYTNAEGQYTLHNIPEGQNTITLQPILPESFDEAPIVSELLNFEGTDVEQVLNICIPQYSETVNDIEVTFLPINGARPGFYPRYSLKVRNNSILLAENVTVTLDFDEARVEVNTVDNPYTVTDENTIVINLGDIPPFGSNISEVKFYAFEPPVNEQGDQLMYIAYASMNAEDDNPVNNYYTLNQTFVNSYDPNSVVVAEGDYVELDDGNIIPYLHYTINFQNLGNASAVNIKIENDLDANFDSDTFEVIAASHNFAVTRTGEHLEFQFPDINLPSSLINEPGSHGYVIYRVKLKADIQEGDIVNNTADIYFDFNSAITTNTAVTEIYSVLDVAEQQSKNAVFYPNPAADIIYIQAEGLQTVSVYDINGRLCLSLGTSATIDVSALKTGMYFVNITTEGGSATYKLMKQ